MLIYVKSTYATHATSTFPIMHLIPPPPPPKILHNLCFPFLFGVRAVPREIKNNAYTKLGGLGNKVHYGKCGSVV